MNPLATSRRLQGGGRHTTASVLLATPLTLLLGPLEELLAALLARLLLATTLLTLLGLRLLDLLLGLPALLRGLLELLALWLLELLTAGLLAHLLLGLLAAHLLAAHLLGALLLLARCAPATDELPALTALWHLVGLFRLAVRRLELARYLLWRHAGCALRSRLGRLLLGQTDLLVDLAFLLLALLLVLGRFLNELPRLRVAGLQFRLDRLVLAERLCVAGVRSALVRSATLGAGEPTLLLAASLLAVLLLTSSLLVALIAHSVSLRRPRVRSDSDGARPAGTRCCAPIPGPVALIPSVTMTGIPIVITSVYVTTVQLPSATGTYSKGDNCGTAIRQR